VVQGTRLDWVTSVSVGDIACTLEGHRGETLTVTVADPSWASPAGSVAITVE